MTRRLDETLVELGIAPSRAKAQDWIHQGLVRVGGKLATKPSHMMDWPAEKRAISIEDHPTTRYVSRAATKLAGFLKNLEINFEGLVALDVGISTGGFTEVLLERSVRQVVGVDVGHGQLHPRLQSHPQITLLEKRNIKDAQVTEELRSLVPGGFDIIVADVSFISLSHILPRIASLLKNGATTILLVKPQFEVGPDALDGRGVVKDPKLALDAVKRVEEDLAKLHLQIKMRSPSELRGRDGNQEYFIWATR